MSEVATRGSGPRGRGSFRGGRGGHSSRGGRGGSRQTAAMPVAEPEIEDEGELGQLKSKYASSLKIVKEMFPDYSNEDIVMALEENGGDLEQTINKMAEGYVSTWGEVKKKDKAKPTKMKDGIVEAVNASGRGARGRGGADGIRGGRARTTERGRGVARGSRGGAAVNGRASGVKTAEIAAAEIPLDEAVPQAEPAVDNTPGWGTDDPAASPAGSWEVVAPPDAALPAAADTAKTSTRPDGTRTWASMLKPIPKPTPSAPKAAPTAAPVVQESIPAVPEPADIPEPVAEYEPALSMQSDPPEQVPAEAPPSVPSSENAGNIEPSEDKLTVENVEQVKDVSHPVETETAASTVGTEGPRSVIGTPLHGPQATQTARPGLGGFQTSALKATQSTGRTTSYQRRMKEQQEAVVMPSNHAVDRAAVQFGSLGLGGSAEDVDDDREEAETRAQPPQHSPIAPRASLPSAAQQGLSDNAPTPRAAPGLPSEPMHMPQSEPQGVPPTQAQYNQFGDRFGGLPGAQVPGAAGVSKPYEPFGQQLAGASHPFDSYSAHTQGPGQQSQNTPSYLGSFGSGGDYSVYNDYQRNPHQYGSFAGQPGQAAHDAGLGGRGAGGFGSTVSEQPSQYATSNAQHSRFTGVTDVIGSGNSSPAPGAPQSAQPGQSQVHTQGHHLGGHGQATHQAPYSSYYNAGYSNPFSYQQQQMGGHHNSHQYGRERPAFDDVRRYDDPYMSQYQQQQQYSGYGNYTSSPYGGGGAGAGKYGQAHQYGISPQTSYDTHNASQGGASTFGRDSGPASFGAYAGRTGSAQPDSTQQGQHQGSSAYSGMVDAFGRTQSGYPGQSSQQGGQPGDDTSRYGVDTGKMGAGGPSPVPNQQRPGSATNTAQSGQGGQQQVPGQQGYGGYPHGAGGLSAFGGHHQASASGAQGTGPGGYGNYSGAGGFGNSYYGASHQQQGRSGNWGGYGQH